MTPEEIRAKALDLAIQFASVKLREEPAAEVDVVHVARDFEEYIAGPAKDVEGPLDSPDGLVVSADGRLLNWKGVNYVVQPTPSTPRTQILAECGVCGGLWSDTHGQPGDPCSTPSTPRARWTPAVRESDTPAEHIEHGDDVWGPLCVCKHSKGNHKYGGCHMWTKKAPGAVAEYCECEGYVKGVAS